MPIHKMDKSLRSLWPVAAVLFLGACAYMGAALRSGLDRGPETAQAIRLTVTDSETLQGIVIREEQSCSPGDASFPDGERVCTPEGSGIFFRAADGYEYLSPETLSGLTVDTLDAMLSAKPREIGDSGRLVTGNAWYYAAFAEADTALRLYDRCTVLFAGESESIPARCVSLSPAKDGKRAAVFRLTRGGDFLSLRHCGAEILFDTHIGISVPEAALYSDGEATYVYTLTAGVVERKAVEIIYRADGYCLAALSAEADALREGNTLIVSGKELYEGKVLG